jgi:hypothetical protein
MVMDDTMEGRIQDGIRMEVILSLLHHHAELHGLDTEIVRLRRSFNSPVRWADRTLMNVPIG